MNTSVTNGKLTEAPQPNVGQQAVAGTNKAGASFSDTVSGFVGNIWNGFQNMNLGPWQIGGMVAGGLLAWTIGNAFGGGGLLGMIISGLLMMYMVPAGRNMFQSFDKSAPNTPVNAQEAERGNAPAKQKTLPTRPNHGTPGEVQAAPADALERAREAVAPLQTSVPSDGPLPLRQLNAQHQR